MNPIGFVRGKVEVDEALVDGQLWGQLADPSEVECLIGVEVIILFEEVHKAQ